MTDHNIFNDIYAEDEPANGKPATNLFESIYKDEDRERELHRAEVERQTRDVDAKRQAEAIRLSKEEGVPPAVAYRQADRLRKPKPTDWTKLDRDAPSLAKVMEDSTYKPVLQGDVDKLGSVERVFRGFKQQLSQTNEGIEVSDIGVRWMDGTLSSDDRARLAEIQAKQKLEPIYNDSYLTQAPGTIASVGLYAGTTLARSWDEVLTGAAAGAAIGAPAGGVVGAPGGPATAALGAGLGAYFGALIGAPLGAQVGFIKESYDLLRGEVFVQAATALDKDGNPLGEDTAYGIAMFAGGTGALLERIGATAIAKAIPGLDKLMGQGAKGLINASITNPALRAALDRLGKVGRAGFAEGSTELIQAMTALETIIAKGGETDDDGNKLADTRLDTYEQALVQGAIGGGGLAAGGQVAKKGGQKVVSFYKERAKAKHQSLIEMGDALRSSEAAQTSPETIKRLADQMDADGAQPMSVSTEALVTLFQTEGLDASAIDQKYPELAAELDIAQQTGAEVKLTADTMTKLMTLPGFTELAQDVRPTQDEMTGREAVTETKAMEEDLAKLSEKDKGKAVEASQREEVKVGIRDQLIAAGQEPSVAETIAEVHANSVVNMAARVGTDPVTFAKRYNLRIENGELAGAGDNAMLQQTPEFKAFFEGSKVVDAEGRPQVVYHGTGSDFDTFDTSLLANPKTRNTGSFFTSNPAVASTYAGRGGGSASVVPTYLNLRNPAVIDGAGAFWSKLDQNSTVQLGDQQTTIAEMFDGQLVNGQTVTTDDISRAAKALGHDGVIFKNVVDRGPNQKLFTSEANEPSDIFVAFDPTQIKSVNNRGTFDPSDPNILFQSVSDPNEGLTPNEKAMVNPIYTGDVPTDRIGTNADGAKWLEENFPGKAITDFTATLSDSRLRSIGNVMAAEAMHALKKTGNASNWYSAAMQSAIGMASVKWPALLDDNYARRAGFGTAANTRFVFTYIMAVTSQNLDVAANAVATNKAFDEMVELVRGLNDQTSVPSMGKWGTGDKQGAMNLNFAKFKPLIDSMVGDTFPEKLANLDKVFRTKMPVSEWVSYAEEVGMPFSAPGQTSIDAVVYGSSVLGPKIGNGFWQNLNGNFSPLTIDLWMRRTWGRLTGKSIGNPDALPDQVARLQASLKRSRSRATPDHIQFMEAYLAGQEHQFALIKKADHKTKKSFDAARREAKAEITKMKAILSDLKNLKAPEPWRAEYATDEKQLVAFAKRLERAWKAEYDILAEKHKKVPDELQPTWAKAAKTIVTNLSKPLDQIANGTQRKQVEKAVAYAKEKLQERGIDVTTADLQAILWYPEKELWGALKDKLDVNDDGAPIIPPSSLNESYDTVFARILKGEGHEVEQRAAGDAAGRAGSGAVSGQDVRSGTPEGQRVLRQSVGPTSGLTENDAVDGILYQADPIFFSGLLKAVELMKQPKAPASQWMGILNKAAGIKKEEMEYLRVEEWLNSQDGSVTREALADYIRANQLEVQEVVRGGDTPVLTDTDRKLLEAWNNEIWSLDKEVGRLWRAIRTDEVVSDEEMVALWDRIDDAAMIVFDDVTPVERPSEGEPGTKGNLRRALILQQEYLKAKSKRVESKRIEPRWENQYVTPGGKNYKELVITMPGQIEPYKPDDIHFTTEGGGTAIGWVRFDERTGPNGERIAHIGEVQSKRHQDGSKKGYKKDLKAGDLIADRIEGTGPNNPGYWEVRTEATGGLVLRVGAHATEAQAIAEAIDVGPRDGNQAVPDAPFKTTWHELMMKRMLRYAVDNGFDEITWDSGRAQIDRYEEQMNQNVDEIISEFIDLGDGTGGYAVDVIKGGKVVYENEGLSENDLEKLFGKEIANKIVKQEGVTAPPDPGFALFDGDTRVPDQPTFRDAAVLRRYAREQELDGYGFTVRQTEEGMQSLRPDARVLKGDDLSIGGTHLKKRYDKDLPRYMAKLTKKMDGKVGVNTVEGPVQTSASYKDKLNSLVADLVKLERMPEQSDTRQAVFNAPLSAYSPEIIERRRARHAKAIEDKRAAIEAHKATAPAPDLIDVWSLPITDKMREEVPKGLPMFQNKEAARGYIQFTEARDIFEVTLTGKADLSTFLHESGHYWLEVMQDLVEKGEAPEQMVADMAAIREWAGVPEGEKFNVGHHEKWAQGFEKYLMEGRAPSNALQQAFGRFKAWLSFVYRKVGLDVELTDEVRGVMDRLIADDQAIAEARTQVGIPKAPMTAEQLNLTPTEYMRYTAAWFKARESEKAELDRKALADYQAEQKSAWRDGIAKYVEEFTERLHATKGWQALAKLEERELKLDKASIPAEWQSMARGLTSERGIDMDSYATSSGWNSGQQMLEAIATARAEARNIPAQARQAMIEQHGHMTPARLADAALEAVHGDDQVEVSLVEFRALAEKAGIKVVPGLSLWMRRQAEDKVGAMTKRQLEPGRWRRAEIKAATESAKAAAKGDIGEAALAKRRQMMAAAMFRASAEAQESVNSIRRYLVPFTNNKRRGVIGKAKEIYLDAIDELLEGVSLKQVSGVTARRLHTLNELIKQAEAEEQALNVPPELADEARRKNFADMTVDEMHGLKDAVKNIWHLAKKTNSLMDEGRKRDMDAVMDEAERTADAAMKTPEIKEKFTKSKIDNGKAKLQNFRAFLTKTEFMLKWLDGKSSGGILHRTLFQPFVDAGHAAYLLNKQMKENLIDKMRDMPAEQQARWSAKRTFLGKEANGATIIAAALNLGTDLNKERLISGETTTEKAMRAEIDAFMTKADWDMVQLIWDQTNSLFPLVSEVARKATGLRPPKQEGIEVVTPFGVYRGGYYPIAYDPERSDLGARIGDKTDALFGNDFASNPILANGFTKARKDQVPSGNPLLLDLGILSNHLAEVIHYVTHYEAVDQANRMIKNRRFKGIVEKHLGKDYHKAMKRWLQDIARNQDTPHDTKYEPVGKAMKWLRGGSSIAIMGYNMFTASKQILGLSTALDAIPAKYLLHGMNKAYLQPLAAQTSDWKFALSKSKELKPLIRGFDRDVKMVTDAYAKKHVGRKLIDPVLENAFVPMGYMQATVNVAVWLGAYAQSIDGGATEAQAVNVADSIVRQTQGTGMIKDMAGVQRGTEINRMMSMYYSWMSVMFNRMDDIAREQRRGGVKNLPNLARRLTVAFLLTTMLEEAAGDAYDLAMGNEDDEDELGYVLSMAMKTGDLMIGTIPFVRTLFSFEGTYRAQLTPVGGVIEDLDRSRKALLDLVTEGEAPSRAETKALVRGLSAATKKPAYGIYRMFDEWFGEDVFGE